MELANSLVQTEILSKKTENSIDDVEFSELVELLKKELPANQKYTVSRRNGTKIIDIKYTDSSIKAGTANLSTPRENGAIYASITITNTTSILEFDIKKTYHIGEEITINGEKFLVIEESFASNTDLKLISKYCLNINANEQVESLDYSKTRYDNDSDEYCNSEIKGLVDKYVTEKLGLDENAGRLLLYSEAQSLAKNNKEILYGKDELKLNYWTGTSFYTSTVSTVNGSYNDYINCNRACSTSNYYGVRPVVIICKP